MNNYELQIKNKSLKITGWTLWTENCFIKKMFFIIVISFFTVTGFSQSYNQLIHLAKKHAERNDFLTAGQLMEDAYSQSPTPAIAFQCAEYYFSGRNFKKAERYYRKVILSDKQNFPLAYFKMATAEKYIGKYTMAAKNFWQFFFKFPNEDKNLIKIARYQKYSCEEISTRTYEIQDLQINPYSVINSSYSEFEVQEINRDSLLFSSFRPRTKYDTVGFYAAIYGMRNNQITLFDTIINFKHAHIPNFFYDDSLSLLLFTACKQENDRRHCFIYQSKFKNGKFSNPQKLNSSVNYAGSNNTQPFLFNTTGNYYLLFASDRSNGYGGYDIYYCSMDETGDFSVAVNLGDKINSPLDEITPYYDTKNKTLYYSSQWFVNFGGYDIFKSHGEIGKWEAPENLGLPTNSSYDDVFYTQNNRETKAYLSSNRLVNADDESQCCNNIYTIRLKDEKPPPVPQEVIINRMKKDLKLMVPLTLYYDNDKPNPRTLDTITQLDYQTTYDTYLQQINEYKKEYSKTQKGKAKQRAVLAIEDFFQDSVIASYERFQKGLSIIEQLLKEGENIQLTIKGFASPLNKTEYNANLSKRRINCVENYLRKYNEGVFVPYLDTTSTKTGNKLYIRRNAFGETKAAAGVSDKLTDLQNSVYSPAASKERKIQIIGVDFK